VSPASTDQTIKARTSEESKLIKTLDGTDESGWKGGWSKTVARQSCQPTNGGLENLIQLSRYRCSVATIDCDFTVTRMIKQIRCNNWVSRKIKILQFFNIFKKII